MESFWCNENPQEHIPDKNKVMESISCDARVTGAPLYVNNFLIVAINITLFQKYTNNLV